MKIVMYHYVRPAPEGMPFFRYLHLDDFRRQLDHFERTYGFVSRADFADAVHGRAEPGPGVVLTFDDGLADHASYVVPELEKRGLWGLFYVPTGPYETDRLLDVHRIHCLIGRYGGVAMMDRIDSIITPDMLDDATVPEFRELTYVKQDNDAATTQFKRLFNYFIAERWRSPVLTRLMEESFSPERELAERFYVPVASLRNMQSTGMIVGSHTISHRVLSRLSVEDQAAEIGKSFAFLDRNVGRGELRSFCYPYGGFHSFTADTERLLAEHGCQFSLNVESRDVSATDVKARPQALPRYDCNEFPHGAASMGARA